MLKLFIFKYYLFQIGQITIHCIEYISNANGFSEIFGVPLKELSNKIIIILAYFSAWECFR